MMSRYASRSIIVFYRMAWRVRLLPVAGAAALSLMGTGRGGSSLSCFWPLRLGTVWQILYPLRGGASMAEGFRGLDAFVQSSGTAGARSSKPGFTLNDVQESIG